jgi:hypothetical protein
MDINSLVATAGATIETPGGALAVRGLALVDITALVAAHRSTLETAFALVTAEGAEMQMGDIAQAILQVAPDLAAMIIALALNEPDNVAGAAKLPVGLQLAILEKVGDLTFSMEGGLGKTMEIVINMLTGTAQTIADLRR